MPKIHSAKKQAANIHTYLVRIYGNGGQFVVASVTESFARFWARRNPNELREHVNSLGDGSLGDHEVYKSPDITPKDRFAEPIEIANIFNNFLVDEDAFLHLQEVDISQRSQPPLLIGSPIILKLTSVKERHIRHDYKLLKSPPRARKHRVNKPVISALYRSHRDLLHGVLTTESPVDVSHIELMMVRTDFGRLMESMFYEEKPVTLNLYEKGLNRGFEDMFVGWIVPSKKTRVKKR